jgi:hypothetical protein
MRIFVGYGYNDRDKWIEEYVFPLLAAMRFDIAHGKVVYGGGISDEIIKVIRMSDAMIGFTTRRGDPEDGGYRTHEWVVQELTSAAAFIDPKIPWVEVRESGVMPPGGALDAAVVQRINYREDDRARCLVEIAQAANRFEELTRITPVRLGPGDTADVIAGVSQDPSFRCEYEVLRHLRQLPAERVAVLPMKGSLFVQLRGIQRDDLVRISVSARGRVWRSSYESVDTVDVQLVE